MTELKNKEMLIWRNGGKGIRTKSKQLKRSIGKRNLRKRRRRVFRNGYAYRKVGYEDLTYKKKAKVKSKEFSRRKD